MLTMFMADSRSYTWPPMPISCASTPGVGSKTSRCRSETVTKQAAADQTVFDRASWPRLDEVPCQVPASITQLIWHHVGSPEYA